jgi:hypothetical protein
VDVVGGDDEIPAKKLLCEHVNAVPRAAVMSIAGG